MQWRSESHRQQDAEECGTTVFSRAARGRGLGTFPSYLSRPWASRYNVVSNADIRLPHEEIVRSLMTSSNL